MQDAIILYENGKAIGGEGHPTYARDITFENEGTDLEAETTQAAIVEVNEKTKHGIVELWINANPRNTFAGQTINITQADLDSRGLNVNINDIDAVNIEFEVVEITMITSQGRIGGTIQSLHTSVTAQGRIVQYLRDCAISRANNTISIAISDATQSMLYTLGSAPTTSTQNDYLVPTIITGIIHNV